MALSGTKRERNVIAETVLEEDFSQETVRQASGEWMVSRLRVLWERRRFLMKALMFGSSLAALVAFSLPKRFESTARLMPPDSQSSAGAALFASLAAKTGAGFIGADLLGMKSSGALFVGILGSRTVQDRLIERFDLKKVYGVRLGETARRQLAENTILSEDRKSGIITIFVTDRDRKRVAALGVAYVEELNHLVAELSTSAAHRERIFLEERLSAVRRDLDGASRNFSQFESVNKTIDLKEQARAMVQGAAALEGELIAAESELKGLEQVYTASNVRVRSVQARIGELRHQLKKLGGQEGQETVRGATVTDAAYPSIRNLPLLGVTYADLYRRLQIQEAVYETLTQQYELAKVQEAKETPSVKILDAASVPERKSFPPRALIALLGAVLASVGAVVALLVRSRWNETPPSAAGRLFAEEVFHSGNGHMPWATPNGSKAQAAAHKIWVRVAGRGAAGGMAETLQAAHK